jgi:hypothetical protein
VRSWFLALLLANLVLFAYLRLAGDQDETGGTNAQPPVARLLRAGEKASVGPRCATIGPFGSQAGAQRAAASLLTARHGSRQRLSAAPGPSSYWVMIGTKTLQDATKISLRLKAAGVTDLAVTPPDAGATDAVISLGLFSDRDHAQRRVEDLRKYAVSPAIVEQPHTVSAWWLDVDLAATDPTPDLTALARVAGEAGTLRASACAAPAAAAPTANGQAPPATSDAPAPNPPASVPAAAKLPGAPA